MAGGAGAARHGRSGRAERISAALFALLRGRAAGPMASEDEDVCDQLRARMAQDPACAPDLEALAGAGPPHHAGQAVRALRLPPQAWLRNWRVARARELLRGGLPLADAAHAVASPIRLT